MGLLFPHFKLYASMTANRKVSAWLEHEIFGCSLEPEQPPPALILTPTKQFWQSRWVVGLWGALIIRLRVISEETVIGSWL